MDALPVIFPSRARDGIAIAILATHLITYGIFSHSTEPAVFVVHVETVQPLAPISELHAEAGCLMPISAEEEDHDLTLRTLGSNQIQIENGNLLQITRNKKCIYKKQFDQCRQLSIICAFEKTACSNHHEPNLVLEEICADGQKRYHFFELNNKHVKRKQIISTTADFTIESEAEQQGHCLLTANRAFDDWGHYAMVVPINLVWSKNRMSLQKMPKSKVEALVRAMEEFGAFAGGPTDWEVGPKSEIAVANAPPEFAETILQMMCGDRMDEARIFFDQQWKGHSKAKREYWKFLKSKFDESISNVAQ